MAGIRRISRPLVLVLDELLAKPRRRHYGYELMQATGIPAGTLYPLLVRLSDAGWLDASWESPTEGDRPRHVYRLTAEGRHAALDLLDRAAARGWSAAPARREA